MGLLLTLYALVANAHTQSVSYSVWHLGEQTSVSFRISQLELNRLGLHPSQPDFQNQINTLVTTWVQINGACQTLSKERLPSEAGWTQLRLTWRCSSIPEQIGIGEIFERINYHTNLAAIYLPNGDMVQTQFNATNTTWLYQPDNVPTGFQAMFEFGLTHIVTGWDHLLFLLVLLLSTNRLAQVLALASGFTVGHSITLAAQVMGLVSPSSIAVEWVIALSILLVAVQNAWQSQANVGHWPYVLIIALLGLGWMGGAISLGVTLGLALFVLCQLQWQAKFASPRLPLQKPSNGETKFSTNTNTNANANAGLIHMPWMITLAFGLFHGFGFAGLLGELQLPADNLIYPLLAFNLGVEAGQVLMIALALPILHWLSRTWVQTPALLNAMAASAATFWLITRTF